MNKERAIPTISVVFFLSGCSALVFEIVWFRIASTVLGSSVWSAAAVLMAFMGGLAIGNGLMATFGHRVINPARFYLVIEAVIGVSGFAVILLLPKLTPFVGSLLVEMSESQGLLSAGRFLIACLFLLLPATAMGATLPVMQKLVHQYDDSFINSIARLYGWNTIGAVFGVLLAEFILIEFLGIISTAAVAGIFNLLVILIMLNSFGKTGKTVDKSEEGKFQRNISRFLAAAFFSGMLLLALEIVWFRYLLVARHGTSVNFAIMLAIVLMGIGLGGLVISRIKLADRYINKLAYFLPIAASILTLTGFYFFQWYFDVHIMSILTNDAYFIFAACILIFPTSFMSGMIFPLLGECVYRENLVVTSSSGYLTMANTIGAVIGSAITTFYLLPEVGIENSIFIIVLAYLFISLLLIKNIKTEVITIFAVVICVIVIFPHGLVKKSYDKVYSSFFPDYKVIAFREGLNQSIAYLEHQSIGKRDYVQLVTNNHSMSTTNFHAQRYMRLYAYFPYLFSNDIEDVLQISYGVGNTAESIIMLPDMKHFDVVDMSPDILELSDIVHNETGFYPLRDKRTVAHVEDGRFFLQTTQNKYDLITAEPPPPISAGVVNLYTQEYFQLIYNALKPEGVTTYWLPLSSLVETDTLAIIKAFCNVFQDCSLWDGVKLNFMLVGSKSGLNAVNLKQLDERWVPKMSSEFSRIGFDTPEQVFATYIGDREYLDKITEYTNPVTDNYPHRISPYWRGGSDGVGLYSQFLDIKRRKESFINSGYVQKLFPGELISAIANEFSREGVISALFMKGQGYGFVLLGDDFNYWDMVLKSMSNEKRDFALLLIVEIFPIDSKTLDEVFSTDVGKNSYRFDYIKYLFLDQEYELLEAEVNKFLAEHKNVTKQKYEAHRLLFLSKIYQNTANIEDVLKSMKLAKGLSKDGFDVWAMKKILAE